MLQDDYDMENSVETTNLALENKKTKAKPFLVRLPSRKAREAYEQYCSDNYRSMDAQATALIIRELKNTGYISDNHTKR